MVTKEELDDALKTLADLKRNDPVIQRGRSAELIRNFKIFWDSRPDEVLFIKIADGLLFVPAMIYHMNANPIKGQEAMVEQSFIKPPPPPTPAPMAQPQVQPQQKGGKKR